VRVLWFGTYSVGPGYPRNTVLMEALRSVGVEVVECHAPLFRGAADKVRAASTTRGRIGFGLKSLAAWARLTLRYFRAGPRDIVLVGYTGHLDLQLARVLSWLRPSPLVLDAFLSPWDTVVNDRALLGDRSLAARLLFGLERSSLKRADLVLTDTASHAAFMAETFGVEPDRFEPIPVGSLISRPSRVPVRVGGAKDAQGDFHAFFCGSFVPLQGVPYILDAAARAPGIEFRLVGDGPDGPRVEEELRQRAMDNVVLERRFIDRETLQTRLAAAGAVLGVFGSTAKAARVVPCKVYDGLAAGLPVVTGDSPAIRELLTDGENALLVDRADPASLVRALGRLRDEPALADRLRSGAVRIAADRFAPRVLGEQLRDRLASLVT